MGLADDLSALYELHKSGGLSESEFQEIKAKMIITNPIEVAKIAKQNGFTKNSLSPIQIGAIAAASSIGTRLILDDLKSDRELRNQVEKLQDKVSDLEEFHSKDNQDEMASDQFENGHNSEYFEF